MAGFSMGIIFGEWWLARENNQSQPKEHARHRARDWWVLAMAVNSAATAALALNSYRYTAPSQSDGGTLDEL